MQHLKAKPASKRVLARGERLRKVVRNAMSTIADVVGSTLGPGGMPVLIERQEYGLPPIVTKDGVTVFRSMSFRDPVDQVVLEAARDAAVKTASEAGDGTTTATILADAIVSLSGDFCEANPQTPPQAVVRSLESLFSDVVEPYILEKSRSISDLPEAEADALLLSVAKTSVNGDEDLASKVLECFDIVGDDGNVTIVEMTGPSSYEVEPIDGYAIGGGFDDSCGKWSSHFVNDVANQQCLMAKPVFLLYHGRLNDITALSAILENFAAMWQNQGFSHNLVVCATGFSEHVVASFASNFSHPSAINIYPLQVPQSPMPSGQLHFLEDLAALTGAWIFDPVSRPLETADVEQLFTAHEGKTSRGEVEGETYRPALGYGPGLTMFEAGRWRSSVIGRVDPALIEARGNELRSQVKLAGSELESLLLQERIGKLTGGIAKLKVFGVSGGETKEKRDRAEDAICAVRGAIRHGALPGGGWALATLSRRLRRMPDPVANKVLAPALLHPVRQLLLNAGLPSEAHGAIIDSLTEGSSTVYDAMQCKHVDAFDAGVVDSTPAVLEAVRNSLSIASLLGTLGGVVVFERDDVVDRLEARDAAEFDRMIASNPADERA